MLKHHRRALAGLALLLMTGVSTAPAGAAAPAYTLTKTVPLGGGTRWDYLQFDPLSDRVFISHGTELTVVDGKSGAIAGHVTGLSGSHGIALDAAAGLGYADSRANRTVSVFDLRTLRIRKIIPALPGADGMAFDPSTGQVFIASGDADAVQAIDTRHNDAGRTIGLGGAPEFLVADGAGALYININDKNEIVEIDTRTDRIVARWPAAPCHGPTGLAIDSAAHRLFSSCANAKMVILDTANGKIVAALPIGEGTDAAAFDPGRKLAFSSNRDGTLTVIKESGPNSFKVIDDVPTAPGARTMTIDPASGRVFLVTATVQSVGAPEHAGGPPSFTFVPGSFKLLIYDPARTD